MKPARELAAITAITFASLLATAAAMALLLLVLESIWPSELLSRRGAFQTGFVATLLVGSLPAVVLGAPSYWLLRRHGRASPIAIRSLGALFGTLVGFVEPAFTAWGGGCGLVTAGLAHMAVEHWLGPNNSSKPTPLRGAA